MCCFALPCYSLFFGFAPDSGLIEKRTQADFSPSVLLFE
ncbi:hypothetical protein [Polaromonas sp. CG9_12]|nr:hypothetical protein [Polaromonas sp. CG9_12]